MRLSRTLNRLVCRVLAAVFLFAQLAVSAYACPDLAPRAAQAAQVHAEANDAMPPGCGEVDEQAANLCAEHCKVGHQNHDTAPVPAVMAPALALLYIVAGDAAGEEADARAPSSDPILASRPPPHAILHCVLRI